MMSPGAGCRDTGGTPGCQLVGGPVVSEAWGCSYAHLPSQLSRCLYQEVFVCDQTACISGVGHWQTQNYNTQLLLQVQDTARCMFVCVSPEKIRRVNWKLNLNGQDSMLNELRR